jgi:hypothetical protein
MSEYWARFPPSPTIVAPILESMSKLMLFEHKDDGKQ